MGTSDMVSAMRVGRVTRLGVCASVASVVVLLVAVGRGDAYTPLPGSPLATGDHPRLFVNANTLPDVVAKCTGAMVDVYTIIKGKADSMVAETGTPDPGYNWSYLEDDVRTLCFVGMIERELGHDASAYLSRAIEYLEVVYGQDIGLPDGSSGYPFEAGISAFAEVYDWMYDLLTPAQRQRYGGELLRYYDDAWATRGSGEMSDRPFNNRYNLTLGALTYGAAAVYGAGIDASKEQAFLDWAVECLGYIMATKDVSGADGGGWHEGWAYALGEAQYASAKVMAAWEPASGEAPFAGNALGEWGLWSVQLTRPMDDRRAHLDEWNLGRDDGKWVDPDEPYKGHRGFYTLLGAKYQDGYAQWIADQSTSGYGWYPSDYNHQAVFDLLFTDTSMAPTAPSNDLPPVRHCVGQGLLIMRSGFESPDDTFALFQARDWFAGHQHRDVNSFIIHKGADLAIETGIYSGWSTDHRAHYFQASLAHNTVLVYDPSDYVANINDGGQVALGNRDHNDIDPIPPEFDISDMRVAIADEYDFGYGDGTQAYDAGNVTNFERFFVRFKPQEQFVVFDRVGSTNASFKKKWLLHMVNEPQVSEPGVVESVEVTDHIMTVRGNRIGFDNAGWAMDVQTLLPTDALVRKVGGPGYRYWVDDNGYTGPAGGANWPPPSSSYGGHTPEEIGVGGWRVELSPPVAALDDLFLNVLEIGQTGFVAADATLIGEVAGDVVGVVIDDAVERRAAVFSRTRTPLQETTFDIPSGPATRVLLCDLQAGAQYFIKCSGSAVEAFTPSDAGTHYFACAGGATVQLLRSLPGDLDDDNDVDTDDYALLAASLNGPAEPPFNPSADLDDDGDCDLADVAIFAEFFTGAGQ